MRKIFVTAFLIVCMATVAAHAIPPSPPKWKNTSPSVLAPASTSVQAADIGYLLLTEYTVATLPTLAAGDAGAIAVINDGDGATDCTTGGGSDRVVCRWTGSAWANAGDGTAEGSAEVQNEPFNSTNFEGDGTHAVSQENFYDLWHGIDTDDDGDIDVLDATVWATKLSVADIDDTPVDSETAAPISSNWAYDHVDAADPHAGYMLESNIGTGANNYLQLGASPGTPDGSKFLRDDNTWAAPSIAAANMDDADHGAVSWSSGVATVETVTVTDNESTDENNVLVFVAGADDNGATDAALESDGNLTYNPSTGTLTATIITDGTVSLAGTGAITGLSEGGLPDSTIVTADVKDNTLTASDLAAALTFADGDQIDLSAITYVESATTNEGLALPTYVANAAPADGKPYVAYDADNNVIMVYEAGGWVNTATASGAATTLNFVTTSAEGTLSNESVLDASSGETGITVAVNAGTPKTIDITFDPTELDAVTWSDSANATNTWTFDVAGTDHTMVAGDGVMTFGDAVTVTDTLTANGNITDGTATWNSSTHALSGFGTIGSGAITSTGAVTGTSFVIGSADISETELGIIDGATLSTTDLNIIDGISDSGDLTAAEILYVDGVTSAIQGQLDARCLESTFGETLQSDDFVVTSTVLNLVAEIPHVDATTSWSADQTFTDGTAVILGTAGEFANVEWDTDVSDNDGDFGTSLTGEGLVFTLNGSAADSKVIFNNSDATYGVDLYVKDIYYSGSITSTDSSAGSYIAFTNNSSGRDPASGEYGIYFETDSVDVLSYSINGTEKRVMNLGDAQTVAGVKTFSERQVLQGDADVGDASNAGSLRLYDGSDHYIDLQTEALSASRTWALPNSYGSANQAFLSDGDGTFSWGNPSADPAGSDTQVQFNNSGSTGADAGFTFNATTDALTLGEGGQDGSLVLYNESGETDYTVTIQPGTQTAPATITLPGSSATLATLGANTFSGHQTLANNYDLLAATPGGSDLGGGSNEFGNIYLHDSAVIYGQADGSATLTSSASTWTASNLASAGTITSVGAILPSVTNTPALGSATYAWSDVFIGDGGVINFNEDMTITHSLDTLTIAGGGLVAPTVTAGSFISSADDGDHVLNVTNGTTLNAALATTDGLLAENGGVFYVSDGSDWDKYLLDSDLLSGADASVISGTAGTNGDLAIWNGDGDLVDGPTPPTGTIVGTTDEQTLTTKTIDAANNVIKGFGYITLTHPHVFASGVTQQTTATARAFGQALFADDADEATNYVEYILEVPRDLDTSVDLVAWFSFVLSDADTADHDYQISMIDIAASADNGTAVGDQVALDYTADGSGASGDVEVAGGNTLTGWAAALTPGSKWIIRVARDGDDGTNDASTVDSISGPLTIRYGFSQ